MDPTAAGTPAPADAAPLSAVDAAVASGKTSEYRTARRAERVGKPLDAVAATPAPADAADTGDTADRPDPPETPAPAAAAPGAPRLTRKERDQQDANERTRKAVEAATADLRAENERLKASAAPRGDVPANDPAAPAPPADKKTPEYKRIMALAGAPKLADFESVEEHAFAAAEFIDSVRTQERETAARTRADHDSMTAAQIQRVDTFLQKLDATKKADPEFTKKLSPEVRALKPFGALTPGEQGGPINVVAEQIMDSPIAPAVMLHLSQHPEALQALVALPPQIAAIRDDLTRQRAHVRHIVQNFNRLEGKLDSPSAAADAEPEPKTISDAPDPAPTLGSKPVETGDPITRAVKSGNTRSYRELRRRERAASLVRR